MARLMRAETLAAVSLLAREGCAAGPAGLALCPGAGPAHAVAFGVGRPLVPSTAQLVRETWRVCRTCILPLRSTTPTPTTHPPSYSAHVCKASSSRQPFHPLGSRSCSTFNGHMMYCQHCRTPLEAAPLGPQVKFLVTPIHRCLVNRHRDSTLTTVLCSWMMQR
jgi:hypothetical protein